MKKLLLTSVSIGIGVFFFGKDQISEVRANHDYVCTNVTYGSWSSSCSDGSFGAWNLNTHKRVYTGVKTRTVTGFTYGNTRTGCDGKTWTGVTVQADRVRTEYQACRYYQTDTNAPSQVTPSFQNQ